MSPSAITQSALLNFPSFIHKVNIIVSWRVHITYRIVLFLLFVFLCDITLDTTTILSSSKGFIFISSLFTFHFFLSTYPTTYHPSSLLCYPSNIAQQLQTKLGWRINSWYFKPIKCFCRRFLMSFSLLSFFLTFAQHRVGSLSDLVFLLFFLW